MNKIALEPEGDENAEINQIEERGLDSVTTKRGNGKNIWPLVGFGIVGVIGVAVVVSGLTPDEAPRPLVNQSPTSQFSTGQSRSDQVPAFQRRLDEEEEVAAPDPRPRRAPPVSGTSTMDAMLNRHRMRMEQMETTARVKSESDRAAFELQRDQADYQRSIEVQRQLQQRQAAPSLVFDASKDED